LFVIYKSDRPIGLKFFFGELAIPKLNLSTGNVYYETMGSGEPIVCIRGFTADHHVWDSLLPLLTARYQLICFDNPGCGQSSTPETSFDIEDFAKVVIELCDHLAIQQALFLGNSMGGAIVQQLAYLYPSIVKKAIISNGFMEGKKLAFSLFSQAREKWFQANLPEETITQAMLSWCFSGNYLTTENVNMLTKLFIENPYPQTEEGYRLQLDALLAFDSSQWLKKIKVPCLLIASDEDAICFPSQIKAMADQVQGSQYVSIPNAGHLPHIEQPEFFGKQVDSFFSQ
jgi:3-oxoadipate enol-lactonase